MRSNLNDCYMLPGRQTTLDVNRFVLVGKHFEKSYRLVDSERDEYLNRSMLALKASQFRGKPIVIEEQKTLELKSYHHTKVPNRHVNVRLLRQRELKLRNMMSDTNE